MKILAIRGRNLASLEGDFELDFTAEPLKSAGIFAITGSTGSGKSTLLDALCLALFDTTNPLIVQPRRIPLVLLEAVLWIQKRKLFHVPVPRNLGKN